MLRFDPFLVGTPNVDLPNRVAGRDPIWTMVGNTHQFVEPANENRPEKPLAVWSYTANPPTALFFDDGHLRINPRTKEHTFCWDPDFQPFKQPTGKISE